MNWESRRGAEAQREETQDKPGNKINRPFVYRYAKGVPPVMKKDKNGAGKRIVPKIGRNDMCPCGSSQKFKKCCVDWKNYAKKQLAIQKEVEKAEGERLKAEKNAGKLPALPGEEHVQGVNPQGAAELPGEEKGGES